MFGTTSLWPEPCGVLTHCTRCDCFARVAVWQALIDDLLTAAGDFETRYPHFTESLLGVRSVFTELLNPIVKVSPGGHSTYSLVALLEVLLWRSLAKLEYMP